MLDFEEERREQLEPLKKYIMEDQPKNWETGFKINIFTHEASLGKTWTIKKVLMDMYRKNKDFKTLFVTKFKEEGEEYIAKSINNEVGEEIAVAVNSNNNNDNEDLTNYPIVVITHSKYKKLQRNVKTDDWYLDSNISDKHKGFFDRDLIVIDEEISLTQIEKLTKSDIEEIKENLKRLDIQLYEDFNKIINLEKIEKVNKYKRISLDIDNDEINEFIEKFDVKVFDDFINRKGCEFSKKDFIEKIERLKFFSGDELLLNTREYVYSIVSSEYFTRLGKKKILLDASGRFHSFYRSGKFHVHDSDRIKSNKNITLHYGKLNTSGSYKDSKDNHENVYKYLHRFMEKNISEEDNVLIIGRNKDKKYLRDEFQVSFNNYIKGDKKDECKVDENSKISFENYQGMRGKDKYGEYDKLFIIHTDYLPKEYYILNYEFNTGEILEDDELETNGGKFIHEPLEQYREDCVLSSFYQATKRIGRHTNFDKKHDIYIFTKEENMIKNRLKYELKDVQIKDIEVPDYRKTRKDSKIFKFIEYLEGLECGEYKKSEIKRDLKISGTTFNNHRDHKEFLEFEKASKYSYNFSSRLYLHKKEK